ncbi:hypothetical protein Pyrde_1021 [Pyrodictium delaneyi]|uniref:RNA-binding protein n=1 Tax=Pyrodictium delaneyi TaxID=1273541 RepID=A0A0P0N421_9CREN|nr:putative RNA uridine N3 methyltransferase [Pyrodictium delaneyi]ALL01069.1 hypothetical protein Pyrde_1021 [Pyrodictium delaneyi]OWJ55757.1 hypothetical protein Pdsh_00535 [Pyrodictium delaneyi]
MKSRSVPSARRLELAVAVPASYLSTEHGLMLKTIKTGILARILAVFRATRLIVYVDRNDAEKHAKLMEEIIGYMLTAPYLKKKLYPYKPELRYVGILPPLQLPTHGVGGPHVGEIREALVVRDLGGLVVLDAGLGKYVKCAKPHWLKRSKRVLVRIESLNPPKLHILREDEAGIYTGFSITVVRGLREALETASGLLRVATSRFGEVLTADKAVRDAREAASRGGIALFFGAPDKGLFEIANSEGLEPEAVFDRIYNTIPNQGTRTVRVEEALAATLAIYNMFLEQ